MPKRHALMEKIRQIQADSKTGSLTLKKEGEAVILYFHEGLISAVRSNIPQCHLGHFLVRQEFIPDSESAQDLFDDARKKRQLIGEAAIQKNLLEAPELIEVIREQVAQVLTYALKSDFHVASFSTSPPFFPVPAQIDFNQLLLELARRNLQPFQADPDQPLVLRNGSNLSQLPWFPQELSVLGYLKSPHSLQDLASATGLDSQQLGKILSVFDTLQLITFAEAPALAETVTLARRELFPFESLIPEIPKSGISRKLEMLQNEQSFISEQFKTLKIRISEYAGDRGVKMLAVSSPQAEDGKSLVSANLAAGFSKDPGRRVILVDGDLRAPSIHRYLGIANEPGLLGYLQEDFLQPYCFMRRLERLYIMTAGGVAPNPVELLTLEKMQRLVGFLKTEFDTIIFDTPPFGPISDAQIITGLSDGLILVTRSGQTTYGNMERTFRNLNREKLIGVVFNDVQPRLFNTQYDYRYYGYKKHGSFPYSAAKRTHRHRRGYLD